MRRTAWWLASVGACLYCTITSTLEAGSTDSRSFESLPLAANKLLVRNAERKKTNVFFIWDFVFRLVLAIALPNSFTGQPTPNLWVRVCGSRNSLNSHEGTEGYGPQR